MVKNNLSIVIISDSRINDKVTVDCLKSLSICDDAKKFQVIIVESDPDAFDKLRYYEFKKNFEDLEVITPKVKFNYNRYLNIGAKYATGYYIAFCNNDLIFYSDWWDKLYQSMVRNKVNSASPICPNTHKEFSYSIQDKVIFGHEIRKQIAGWCIVLNRNWYVRMKGFDERFTFWCADNSYGKQLEQHGEKHILDCSSCVVHLGSQSLGKISADLHDEFTRKQVIKFNKEFGTNIFNLKS